MFVLGVRVGEYYNCKKSWGMLYIPCKWRICQLVFIKKFIWRRLNMLVIYSTHNNDALLLHYKTCPSE